MIEWFEGPRSELADLFALADDSAVQVERYRDLGRVLVARDGSTLIGHLQLIPCEHTNEAEIKSLAVREDRQGSGIGRSLMTRAIAACREQDRAARVVATALPNHIRNRCWCCTWGMKKPYRRSRRGYAAIRSPPPTRTGASTPPSSPTRTGSRSSSSRNSGSPELGNSPVIRASWRG